MSQAIQLVAIPNANDKTLFDLVEKGVATRRYSILSKREWQPLYGPALCGTSSISMIEKPTMPLEKGRL
jgi:hypothetical protein